MAVRAQDRIRAALKELLCQRLLRLRHLERCLAAPVEHHEDDVGLKLLRRVHRPQQRLRVELFIVRAVVLVKQIHRVLRALRQLQTAEALGIGDDRYLQPADIFDHHAVVGRAFRGVGVGARVVDAGIRQIADRALQAGQAVLDGAGVRRLQQVKADGRKRRRQRLRRAVIRLACIGRAAEIALEIPDRQIGRERIAGHGREALGKVIAAVRLLRVGEQLVRDHDIADGGDGHGGIRLRLELQRGVLFRVELRMLAPIAAAAQDEDQRQHKDHQQYCRQHALAHQQLPLLLLPAQTPRLHQLLVLPAFHMIHARTSCPFVSGL